MEKMINTSLLERLKKANEGRVNNSTPNPIKKLTQEELRERIQNSPLLRKLREIQEKKNDILKNKEEE